MTRPGVWVTGVGSVSTAGSGAPALLGLLLAEQSGVRSLPELDGFPGAPAPEPVAKSGTRHLDRSAKFFFAAAEEAWSDAGLDDAEFAADRCGVIEGSSLGPMTDLLSIHRARCISGNGTQPRPSALVRFMIGAGSAAFAQARRIRGPVWHVSAGSVSSACAIGEAYQRITAGLADIVVAGGAECPLHPEVVGTFHAARVLAPDEGDGPVCRPFDARRAGTLLGEGAGVLVLESIEHARRRGARPRATLEGYGATCEAYSMIAPDPSGAGVTEAVRLAMQGRSLDEVAWIKAHGTGTRQGDAAECRGLAAVFGQRLERVPLTSLKPAIGHCLGSSGAVEAVATVLALEEGVVPRTLGTECADPELPACRIATQRGVAAPGSVLLLSESFGGRCAALAVGSA